jgi:hypothetical protein
MSNCVARKNALFKSNMTTALKYWQLVRLNSAGERRVETIAIAKSFFQQCFAHQTEALEAQIHRILLLYLGDDTNRDAAKLCLRCYVSHQIEQVSIQLERQFGGQHGFTQRDLLPLVLTDDGRIPLPTAAWRSLGSEIVETFDPSRSSLNTWVLRQVRHHRDMNTFLLERGVYLITDWALLNDTTPTQAKRILSEFYNLTLPEVNAACHLLQGYHQVYRQDRLKQRLSGQLKGKATCSTPTTEQLSRIAACLESTASTSSHQSVLTRLQTLASQLRQYRIHVRGGNLLTVSSDQPETYEKATWVAAPETDSDGDSVNEFLNFYREQLTHCLDETLEQVTGDRLIYLQRKKPDLEKPFLLALQLFHCQGQSMGEIATKLGMQAQYQVTRLIKLKEFRADVQQRLLKTLTSRVLDRAKDYATPECLHNLQQQVEAALDDQVTTLIEHVEAEAAIAKKQPLRSLFARRLCRHLDARLSIIPASSSNATECSYDLPYSTYRSA